MERLAQLTPDGPRWLCQRSNLASAALDGLLGMSPVDLGV